MLKRAHGFSLVEFMIAITIGLFLVAGLVYLIAETSRSRAEIERSSRQIENGRYALDRIAEDLRHAGFFSEYFSVPAAGETGFPASLTTALPCATAVGTASPPTQLRAGMPLAIQAYDGATLPTDFTGASGANCAAAGFIAANWQAGTDILVVRRAATTAICPTGKTCTGLTPTALVADQPYIQSTPLDYKLDLGSNLGTFTLTLPTANNTATADAPVRRYLVRIYFVAACNVPASGTTCNGATDDGGVSIPTLKMLELGPGPAFTLLPVAEGIERLEFDFGIDDTGDGVADRVVMCDAATPCSAVDFSNVVTVHVHIVARNTEMSPSFSDDKEYRLGLKGYVPVASGPQYRRHAYSSLVRLNNVAMRRE